MNTLEIPAVKAGVITAITPREGHNVLTELLSDNEDTSRIVSGDGESCVLPDGTDENNASNGLQDSSTVRRSKISNYASGLALEFEDFIIGGSYEGSDLFYEANGAAAYSAEGDRHARASSEMHTLHGLTTHGRTLSRDTSGIIDLSRRIERHQMVNFMAVSQAHSMMSGDMRASPRSALSGRPSHFPGEQPAEGVTGWLADFKRAIGVSDSSRHTRSRAPSAAAAPESTDNSNTAANNARSSGGDSGKGERSNSRDELNSLIYGEGTTRVDE